MNWEQAKGRWNQWKAPAKVKWSRLTDNDLEMIDGRRDQLISKLQERYGIAREEAEKQVNRWEPFFDTLTGGSLAQRKAG